MRPREQVNFRCGKAKWSQESQSYRAERHRRVLACRSEGSLWKTGVGKEFWGTGERKLSPKAFGLREHRGEKRGGEGPWALRPCLIWIR